MQDYEYEVAGAEVIFSNAPKPPYNPLRRPPVSYKKPIIAIVIYLLTTTCVTGLAIWLLPQYAVWFWLGWSVLYFCVIAKRTAIWMVHLYQNKASDATRLKCVFEPSCSEYMLLAIDKYGVTRGVCKGCGRLLRCKPENSGVDYP